MAGGSSNTSFNEVKLEEGKNYTIPLMVLTSLFFMWAVATNFNDVLMPKLQKTLSLDPFETSFVQVAFFFGYGIMAIPAGLIIKKIGYKKGILVGLATCALGALMFIPAANIKVFSLFLIALFIIAGGITFLQVAANAFVAVLGDPKTASSRLNLSQAFNSMGAFVGPQVAAMIMFSESAGEDPADAVKLPYKILAGLFILIFIVIYFSKLPEIIEPESEGVTNPLKAFKFKHTTFAVIAIFFYVGAEVGIGSYFIRFAEYLKLGLKEEEANRYLVYYMICAAAGRFGGSYLLKFISPGKLVGFNALGAVACILTAIFAGGYASLIALVLVGLMNSIMFPTIFTLGIAKLGDYTKEGSSLIITAIVGGAFIAPIMGLIMKHYPNSFEYAYFAPIVCYLYIIFFGFKGSDSTYLDKK
ncbi:MAG TPA: sugar MFS transporter [Cytophagaceae bacterium]|jgi:FHS family L-fucose permease-like MFS transporter|nr:sugar MFS transporter [Cytophagaceae bacterium]